MPPAATRRQALFLLMFATGFLPVVSVVLVSLFNHVFFNGNPSPMSTSDSVSDSAAPASDLSPPDGLKSTHHEYWIGVASSSLAYVARTSSLNHLYRPAHQTSSMWRQHVAYQEQTTMIRALVTLIVVVVALLFGYIYALCTLPRMQQYWKRPTLIGTSVVTTSKKLSPRKERIQRQLMDYRITYQGPEWRSTWWQKLWRRENDSNHNSRDNESIVVCSICLTEFRNGEDNVISPRCHCTRSLFHESCILMWLAQTHRNPYQKCPCCRSPFFPNANDHAPSTTRSELRSFYRVPRETAF
jgi:hypothetical protein